MLALLTGFVGLLAAFFAPLTPARQHAQLFIRVDQLGYSPGTAKRAYLISNAPESGKTFVVREAHGGVALSGVIGNPLQRVNTRFRYVYALPFDSVMKPGTYVVSVSHATSPRFVIDAPGQLYRQALSNALSFYRVQRDGPDFIRSALRTAPGHLNDRHARTYLTPKANGNGDFKGDLRALPNFIDAAGGWWDAGDYLKFVETTSYTTDLMLTGVRDFPAEMGDRARGSNFTGEARFGLKWLLHMWEDRTRTLYYQVGIGEGNSRTIGDHDIWRLPQADDHYGASSPQYRYIRHRPVFRAGPPRSRISPNLAGRDAAAFALCFQVFRKLDDGFAAQCLRAAEHVYALADTHPHKLTTALPFDFYPETEWRDDLELGATELAIALRQKPPSGLTHTSAGYYLRQAIDWARAYAHHEHRGDSLNLYDVSGLANYDLYRALPTSDHTAKAMLLASIRSQLKAAVAQAAKDPFGAGFPWNTYDSATHLAGLSVQASEYASLTDSSTYRSWSVHWLDNLLGVNAWGASLIIGDGTTFPHCPQHQVANLAGSLDGSAPVLKGALVEGPNSFAARGRVAHMRPCPPDGHDRFRPFDSKAVFKDDVQSYSTVEPAIDLTAGSPLAFSWQIASQHH